MRVSKCFSKIFFFLILSVSILNLKVTNGDNFVMKEDLSKPTYTKVRV